MCKRRSATETPYSFLQLRLLPFVVLLLAAVLWQKFSNLEGDIAAANICDESISNCITDGAPTSLSLLQKKARTLQSSSTDNHILQGTTPSSQSTAGSKPNLVVLFSDDTGFGDFGFNGAKPSETPNLDALAKTALRFTDFHASASVCTPSRAALLTGRLGARTGVTDNFGTGSQRGLDTDEATIAEVLKTAGYDTKMIGKWHLGHHPKYHPSYRGFDQYVGLPYSHDLGCLDNQPTTGWDWVGGKDGHPSACPVDLDSTFQDADADGGPEIWGDTALNGAFNAVPLYNSTKPNCKGNDNDKEGDCNRDIVEQPVKLDTLNSRYSDEAVKFIKEHSGNSNPFFLYLPFAHTHIPFGVPQEFVNSSTSKTIYGDVLRELDHTIGAIIGSLRITGLESNTLVVFTADNGPWNAKCDLAGSQGPFLGTWQKKQGGGGATGKFTTWEGGHREPGLFYWKGRISPGVSHALASTLDLMPTLAALAGASLPKNRSWDGLDLAPVLFKGSKQNHQYLFHPDGKGNLNAMRLGELKAFWQTYSAGACGHKSTDFGNMKNHDPPLVFNLTADPAESTPITVGKDVIQKMISIREKTKDDIQRTLRHEGHYQGGEGKRDWACSNQASKCCRKEPTE